MVHIRALFVGVLFLSACGQSPPQQANDAELSHAAKPTWVYGESIDKMRGEKWFYAELQSSNQPELESPYSGGSPLTLQFSKLQGETHPDNYAPRLVLSNGQYDCSGSGHGNSCMITAKADDQKPVELHAVETDCGDAKCLVLHNDPYGPLSGKSVIGMLRKTNRLIIEVPLYRFGSFQYEFDTAGLDWSEDTAHR